MVSATRAHQLADAGLPLGRAQMPVQVLRGHDVGRGDRPVRRRLDILLLEDDVALLIGNRRGALLPLNLVIGGDALGGEAAGEDQAPLGLGSLLGSGGRLKLDLIHKTLSIGKYL